MIARLIISAAAVGALAAGAALYTVSPSAWRNPLAAWRGESDRAAQVANAEDWPVCTTMTAIAGDADWAQLDPDFAAGKKAMAAGDWHAAIGALKLAALRDPDNADIQNYIGYAYRRLRQPGPALAHFQQAIAFNPRHRGAHQHLGEAYLASGNVGKAEEHLAALERICLIPCEEYEDLRKAVAAVRGGS